MAQPLPLNDTRTHFALIRLLEDAGWEWRHLAQTGDYYEIGQAKVWKTRVNAVTKQYLLCLLQAVRLRKQYGFARIYHGRTPGYYTDLLNGVLNEQPGPLEDDAAVEKPAPVENQAHGDHGVDSDVDSDDMVLADLLPAQLPPPAPGLPAGIERRRSYWGPFRLTPKPPTATDRFGRWEASCPFHRKNTRTGCKKSDMVLGGTQEDQERSLWRLKHWCNSALHFTRQHQHVYYTVHDDNCPAPAITTSQMIPADRKPPGLVRTDVELAAEEAARAVVAAPPADAEAAEDPAAETPNPAGMASPSPGGSTSGSPASSASSASSSTSSSSGSSDSD